VNSLLPKWWGVIQFSRWRRVNSLKKKVEETTSFVPGEEKKAVGEGERVGCLRLAPVRHDLYFCYTCAFDLERVWEKYIPDDRKFSKTEI
jgi:hypothetical protein